MAQETALERRRIDKAWLRRQFAEQDAAHGYTLDASLTAPQVRALMEAEGVRPEENSFSRELLCQCSKEGEGQSWVSP